MNKLLSILVGAGLVYILYAFGISRWDYTSEKKRLEIKTRIQQQGFSTRFYFISPRRLLIYLILSGGLFGFYWAYKQWEAIADGYCRTPKQPLPISPATRSICSGIFFYQLTALVNRTCVYVHKQPALPPLVWGTAFWAGGLAACLPGLPWWGRLLGVAVCFAAPYHLQIHINLMPKELPPSRLKLAEVSWLIFSWCVWWGLWMGWQTGLSFYTQHILH